MNLSNRNRILIIECFRSGFFNLHANFFKVNLPQWCRQMKYIKTDLHNVRLWLPVQLHRQGPACHPGLTPRAAIQRGLWLTGLLTAWGESDVILYAKVSIKTIHRVYFNVIKYSQTHTQT